MAAEFISILNQFELKLLLRYLPVITMIMKQKQIQIQIQIAHLILMMNQLKSLNMSLAEPSLESAVGPFRQALSTHNDSK
jgi:hypothetical protein